MCGRVGEILMNFMIMCLVIGLDIGFSMHGEHDAKLLDFRQFVGDEAIGSIVWKDWHAAVANKIICVCPCLGNSTIICISAGWANGTAALPNKWVNNRIYLTHCIDLRMIQTVWDNIRLLLLGLGAVLEPWWVEIFISLNGWVMEEFAPRSVGALIMEMKYNQY